MPLFPDLPVPEQLARDISIMALRHYNAGGPFFVGRCACTRAAKAGTIFYGGAPVSICPYCGEQYLLDLILPPKGPVSFRLIRVHGPSPTAGRSWSRTGGPVGRES